MSTRAFVILSLALITVALPGMSGGGKSVKLAGHTGQTGSGTELAPGLVQFSFDGVGRLVKIGNVLIEATQIVDFTTNPAGDVSGTGKFTVVATGDEIHFAHEGSSTLPDALGVIDYEFAMEVTGGTGKFAGATGSGTLLGAFRFGIPMDCGSAMTGTGESIVAGKIHP